MPPNSEGGGDPHHQAASHTTNNTSTAQSADNHEFSCTTGRCTLGEPCVCDFYAGWTIYCPPPIRSLPEQLRRRREAAHRSPRLACGRRDPISQSRW